MEGYLFMESKVLKLPRKRLKEVNWFPSQKEARAWARNLGQKLKPWTEIEPAGFCRKSEWLVQVYEIKEEEEK